jgi:hypothetical protein
LKTTSLGLALGLLALSSIGCKTESKPLETLHKAVWKPVGSWSGRAGIQTESFELGGQWRIRWEAKNESSPGAGSLKISVHSAVSGRPLFQALDQRGLGHGTVDVTEDPHLFYLVIEASNIDWSVTAEEPVAGDAGNS